MSGRDLGHFGCDGRYRLPPGFNQRAFVEFVMDGVKDNRPKFDQVKFDHECRLVTPPVAEENLDDHTLERCRSFFPDIRSYRGAPFPPVPLLPKSHSVRDALREQADIVAKYAAHCEQKASTCSNVATLLEYTSRAKLARDIALIYFRAATLED